MSRARVILGAVALLCVPAGIVLIAVAVLQDNPPSARPRPALATTTSTAVGRGAWLLDDDTTPTVTLGIPAGGSSALEVVDGGIAVDQDRILGGTLEVRADAATAEVLGLPAAEVTGHLVFTDEHDVGTADAATDEVVQARLDLGGVVWAVPGAGSFVAVDDGTGIELTFVGTAGTGSGDPDPAGDFEVAASATFGAPS